MILTNLILFITGFAALLVHSGPSTNTLQKRTKFCDTDHTTWVNRISDVSAFRVHCEKLAANIWGDAYWTFYPADGQQRIAQYRSCAFGGTATGSSDKFVDIGNEDVRSLVWGSIDRFHEFRNGIDRVQARGDLCCLSCDQDTTHRLDWGLYAMKGTWPPNSNIVLGKENNGGRYNFTEEEYQAFREGRGELPEPEGDGTVVWWAGEEKGGLKTGDDWSAR